jgi:hypothetical protein
VLPLFEFPEAKEATGLSLSPQGPSTNALLGLCEEANAAKHTRTVATDNTELVIYTVSSRATDAARVVKHVLFAEVQQDTVAIACTIKHGGYDVSLVVDIVNSGSSRPFPFAVKWLERFALISCGKGYELAGAIRSENRDDPCVVDKAVGWPYRGSTSGTWRVDVRDLRANLQKSMRVSGRVNVRADYCPFVVDPGRLDVGCAFNLDVSERLCLTVIRKGNSGAGG